MKHKSPAMTVILAFLLIASGTSRLAAQSDQSDLAKQIDQIVNDAFRADQPGGAVLATKDGKTVYKSARGMADLEMGVSLHPDMVFRLGSITKQFTAAAVMMLVEEGKVALNDDITKFLPDYPTQGTKITVEQLLNHTSGIRSYTGIPGWMQNKVINDLSVDELIAGFQDEPMDFQPGSEFRYNNSGYVLLGAIIEKASGQSYADFINARIFQPLKMVNSYYGDHSRVIPNRVEGYDGPVAKPVNAKYLSMSQPYAAGSLLSSVADLSLWNRALFAGEVVKPESLQQMIARGKLTDGNKFDYGFGLVPGDIRGHKTIAHGGGIFGFSTYAVYLPDDDVYVTVLCNCSSLDPSRPATKIAALVAGDPFPEFKKVDVGEEILQRYVGVYKIDEKDRRFVILEEGQLYTQRTGGNRLAALPHSETGFFYEATPSHFEFIVDDKGNVSGMDMYQGGSRTAERAVKVEEEMPAARQVAEVDFALYDDYVGEYEMPGGMTISITREGDRLFAQPTGQQALEIFPESETVFFLKQVDAQVTFIRGDDDKVTEIVLNQGGREGTGKRK